MDVDPDTPERLDLHFAALQYFLSARFGGPDSALSTFSDFLFDPWSPEHPRWASERKPEVAATLKSIFAQMPGVVIHPPEEKK